MNKKGNRQLISSDALEWVKIAIVLIIGYIIVKALISVA